jgi:hypothetical protein
MPRRRLNLLKTTCISVLYLFLSFVYFLHSRLVFTVFRSSLNRRCMANSCKSPSPMRMQNTLLFLHGTSQVISLYAHITTTQGTYGTYSISAWIENKINTKATVRVHRYPQNRIISLSISIPSSSQTGKQAASLLSPAFSQSPQPRTAQSHPVSSNCYARSAC